jgi:hypothetical protein
LATLTSTNTPQDSNTVATSPLLQVDEDEIDDGNDTENDKQNESNDNNINDNAMFDDSNHEYHSWHSPHHLFTDKSKT